MSITDNVLLGLVQRLGISPKDVREMASAIARANSVLAEVDAFKQGAAAVVAHFNKRLDAIEARQEYILTLLQSGHVVRHVPEQPEGLTPSNGVIPYHV